MPNANSVRNATAAAAARAPRYDARNPVPSKAPAYGIVAIARNVRLFQMPSVLKKPVNATAASATSAATSTNSARSPQRRPRSTSAPAAGTNDTARYGSQNVKKCQQSAIRAGQNS